MTSALTIVTVLAAGALGALARWLLSRRNEPTAFPTGTFIANIVGSFLLGILTARGGPGLTLLGTGFLGALTTFSTFINETVERADDGRGRSVTYLVSTVIAGIAAALVGLQFG